MMKTTMTMAAWSVLILACFIYSVHVNSSECKPVYNNEFQIVRLICTFSGNHIYEFDGRKRLESVKMILFDRFSKTIVLIVQYGQPTIKILTGSVELCKTMFTHGYADVFIGGELCVSVYIQVFKIA